LCGQVLARIAEVIAPVRIDAIVYIHSIECHWRTPKTSDSEGTSAQAGAGGAMIGG
jgi:hypothetical protein